MKKRLLLLLLSFALIIPFLSARAQDTVINFMYAEEVVNSFEDHLQTVDSLPELTTEFIETYMRDFINEQTDGAVVIRKGKEKEYQQDSTGETWFAKMYYDEQMGQLLKQRKEQLDDLKKQADRPNPLLKHLPYACIALVIVLLTILFIRFKKKNKKVITTFTPPPSENKDIIVRRKTTSILKKQSLEDVIDNENYKKIDCNDFCSDSAVRRIYIKNTCIKSIYNMYADDLRNPDNPKEDGCMVLGRWVFDKECNEYYVSLEEVVLPGDDAIFSEYELNFGGKIKLKVKEALRKLRTETELQYDLTCWVHSHPGLSVFFSNSDCNVQAQLKHPTHPNFLTAIVIDILTPEQELGIFTFKHDSTINSRSDLRKMYSLEDWYKWAVESCRNALKYEDYYNSLSTAKLTIDECSSIQLSNSAIIDMGILANEQPQNFIGTIHGFSHDKADKKEYVVTTVSKEGSINDFDPIGTFIITTHCSIPSIRKTIAGGTTKSKFVLVYSTSDGLLTSIPLINNDLCDNQNYYGEQSLEELKIWTRRKR